ncbi:MAG: phosphate signaling complex protein PhoU [Phycisphaerae bacterium]|nr:phosphate signaling complex protein PhoU [Phycisphaerae bacterium]
MSPFETRLADLERDLVLQGTRVLDLCTQAVESHFDVDLKKAARVVELDNEVDRVDVEIEKRSVPLLALGQTDEHQIRRVLTVVKVNNEYERIADCGVSIAERVIDERERALRVPDTFRVMANSVLGMLRDTNRALERHDANLGRQVLLFDDTVDRFKKEIMLHAQEQVAAGQFSVRFAFGLISVTKNVERISEHCTNICEQVIYLESGLIVRHRPEGWSAPTKPSDSL